MFVTRFARQPFTFREYVELEETSPDKHEFLEGEVWAITGGSPDHAGLAAKIIAMLGAAVQGRPCRVFSSDLRIRVAETGLASYPDASIVCGELELDPEDPKGHTVLNPLLLVEVLSPSTEAYDRGEKLAHYQRIASLREVLLLAHDEPRLDLWRRRSGSWTLSTHRPGDRVILTSLETAVLDIEALFRDPLKR